MTTRRSSAALPYLWICGLATLVIDQLTKVLVVHVAGLATVGSIDVLPPWLSFRMAWNRGVNFGLLSGDANLTRWILIGVAAAITVWVIVWVCREQAGPRTMAAAGLLVGGAVGNALDRVIYGAVADFLNMSCCGIDNPYAFNVADIAIFLGAVGLILFSGREKSG